MNTTPMEPIIALQMRRSANTWKWLKLLRHSGTLLIIISLGFLGIGLMRVQGFIVDRELVLMASMALGLSGLGLWLLMVVVIGLAPEDETQIANALESAHPALQDGLNTLVYLQGEHLDPVLEAYTKRIERQTAEVVFCDPVPAVPFSVTRPLVHAGFCLALLLSTSLFYWGHNLFALPTNASTANNANRNANDPNADDLQIPAPEELVREDEVDPASGEITIVEPGQDLIATRADAFPLRIEAATGRPIDHWKFITMINNGPEVARELPDPKEPMFAWHQELLKMEDFDLKDFDTLVYRAEVVTQAGDLFASPIYRIEIRPFREDLLKESGGEDSDEYEQLANLTALIERQQEQIRITESALAQNKAAAKTDKPDSSKNQDRIKNQSQLTRETQKLTRELPQTRKSVPAALALREAESAMDNAAKAIAAKNDQNAKDQQVHARNALETARRKMHQSLEDRAFPERRAEALRQTQKELQDHLEQLRKLSKTPYALAPRDVKTLADSIDKTAEKAQDLATDTNAPIPNQWTESLDEQTDRLANTITVDNPTERVRSAERAAVAVQNFAERLAAGQPLKPQNRQNPNNRTNTNPQNKKTQSQDALAMDQIQKQLEEQIRRWDQESKSRAPQQMETAQLRDRVAESRKTLDQLQKFAQNHPSPRENPVKTADPNRKNSPAAPDAKKSGNPKPAPTPDPLAAPNDPKPPTDAKNNAPSDPPMPKPSSSAPTTKPTPAAQPDRPQPPATAPKPAQEPEKPAPDPETTPSAPKRPTVTERLEKVIQDVAQIQKQPENIGTPELAQLGKTIQQTVTDAARQTADPTPAGADAPITETMKRQIAEQTQTLQENPGGTPLSRSNAAGELKQSLETVRDALASAQPQASPDATAANANNPMPNNAAPAPGTQPQPDPTTPADAASAKTAMNSAPAPDPATGSPPTPAPSGLMDLNPPGMPGVGAPAPNPNSSVMGQPQPTRPDANNGKPQPAPDGQPQSPADAFAPLRDALKPEAQQAVRQSLNNVQNSAPGPQRAQASGDVRDQLEQVANALDAAEDQLKRPQGDPFQPQGDQAIARALKLLDSLEQRADNLAQQQNNQGQGQEGQQGQGQEGQQGQGQEGQQGQGQEGQQGQGQPGQNQRGAVMKGGNPGMTNPSGLPQELETAQREEALELLEQGMGASFGYNERTAKVVKKLHEALDEPTKPVDNRLIEQLVKQANRRTVDRTQSPTVTRKPQNSRATDPARWPALYRQRIAKYYETLSESETDGEAETQTESAAKPSSSSGQTKKSSPSNP